MAYQEITKNLISQNNRLESRILSNDNILQYVSPTNYAHGWTFTNAVATVVSGEYIHPLQYSFEILPVQQNTPVVIQLNNFTVTSEILENNLVQFHARIKCDRRLTSSILLTDENGSSSTHVTENVPGSWSTVWSEQLSVSSTNPSEFSVSISLTGHSGSEIYLTLPVLVNDGGFYNNPFVQNARRNLPSFMWDMDKEQSYPQYPYYKLIHALTYYAGIASQMSSNFYRFSQSEISAQFSDSAPWASSILVDADYVSTEYQNWLAQFIGAKLIRSITYNGNELVADPEEFSRWQLNNAYFGREAGTREALTNTVKQILSGNKVVYIFPGGTSFTVNIYTLLSETPGVASVGDTSQEVLRFAELTRPLGFSFNHEVFTTLSFILDSEEYAVLDFSSLG